MAPAPLCNWHRPPLACREWPRFCLRLGLALVVALAFGLPVGTDLTAGTEPAVIHAQIAGCDLVTTGCRLEIGQARQAVLNDATSPHVWLLHVDADEDVLVGTTC